MLSARSLDAEIITIFFSESIKQMSKGTNAAQASKTLPDSAEGLESVGV